MRNVLIIGASSGIGQALAERLHHDGHRVYGTYLNHVVESDYEMHKIDAAAPDLSFIPDHLDGMVYCPGAISLKPFTRCSPADFLVDYELQVLGFVRVLQKALPALKKGSTPSVVAFSTAAVAMGFPFHSLVSASKGALEGLVKALAAEHAPHIRFNCVAPSITDTPLASGLLNSDEKRSAASARHPMRRIGTAPDIASACAFLLSSDSTWISGQVLHVDGGITSLKI